MNNETTPEIQIDEEYLSELVDAFADKFIKKTNAGEQIGQLTPLAIKHFSAGLYEQITETLPKKPGSNKCDWTVFYRILSAEYPQFAALCNTPENIKQQAIIKKAAEIVKILRAKNWAKPLSPAAIRDIYGSYDRLTPLLPFSSKQNKQRDWTPIKERLEEFAPLWDDPEKKHAEQVLKLVIELTDWLNQTNPAAITPVWLKANNKPLYYRLVSVLKFYGKTNWDIIFDNPQMPPKWRDLWKSKAAAKFSRADIILIREKLKQLQPAVFGPAWLETNLGRAAEERIIRRLPLVNGVRHWEALVEAIDEGVPPEEQWGDRWHIRRGGNRARQMQSVLDKYKESLHTFVAANTPKDIKQRDEAVNALLNLAQHDDSAALDTLYTLLKNLINQLAANDQIFEAYLEDDATAKKIFTRCVNDYKPGSNQSFVEYFKQKLRTVAQIGHGRDGISF